MEWLIKFAARRAVEDAEAFARLFALDDIGQPPSGWCPETCDCGRPCREFANHRGPCECGPWNEEK
jgi:hypothetical protein